MQAKPVYAGGSNGGIGANVERNFRLSGNLPDRDCNQRPPDSDYME